jgi:hypothetical protein
MVRLILSREQDIPVPLTMTAAADDPPLIACCDVAFFDRKTMLLLFLSMFGHVALASHFSS